MADHPARARSKQRRLQIVLTTATYANRWPRPIPVNFAGVTPTAVPLRDLLLSIVASLCIGLGFRALR
jgi:hypothetical protein